MKNKLKIIYKSLFIKEVIYLFVISRIVLLFFGTTGDIIFPNQSYYSSQIKNIYITSPWYSDDPEYYNQLGFQDRLLYFYDFSKKLDISFLFSQERWQRLDAGWYEDIVKNGYDKVSTLAPHDPTNWPFYPLYPFSVKLFNFITFNTISIPYAGMIVSNIFLYFGLLFLYKFVREKFGENVSFKTLFYLLIFPTSIYFSLMYTESLFLFLTAAGFYAIEKKKWIPAIILAALLTATRTVGVLFSLILAWEFFKENKFNIKSLLKQKVTLLFLTIPIPILSFYYYLYTISGSFTAALDEVENWGRPGLTNPIRYLLDYIVNPSFFGTWHFGFVAFSCAIFGLIMTYFVYKKLGFGYFSYCLLSILIPMSSSLTSFPRYLLSITPIFIVLGFYGEKNKYLDTSITLVSAGLFFIYLIGYVNGYFFVA